MWIRPSDTIPTFLICRWTPELCGEVQACGGLPHRPVLPDGSVLLHGGWPPQRQEVGRWPHGRDEEHHEWLQNGFVCLYFHFLLTRNVGSHHFLLTFYTSTHLFSMEYPCVTLALLHTWELPGTIIILLLATEQHHWSDWGLSALLKDNW